MSKYRFSDFLGVFDLLVNTNGSKRFTTLNPETSEHNIAKTQMATLFWKYFLPLLNLSMSISEGLSVRTGKGPMSLELPLRNCFRRSSGILEPVLKENNNKVFDYWDVFCMAVSLHRGSTNGSAIFFSALPKRRKIVSNYHQSTSLISTIKMFLNTLGITTVTLIRQGLTLCLSNISFILPFEHYVNILTVLRQE